MSWSLIPLCDNRCTLLAQTCDGCAHHVSGLQVAIEVSSIACRRAGADQIARLQLDQARNVLDQSCDIENHVGRRFVLLRLSVELERDLELLWIGDECAGHDNGPTGQ